MVSTVPIQFSGRITRVMTYNLNSFRSAEGPKAEAIASAILPYDPDVIAFQEVQEANVLSALNNKHLKGRYPNHETNDSNRLAFVSKAGFPLTNVLIHSQMDSQRFPPHDRGILEVTVRPKGVEPLTLLNMHLRTGAGKLRNTAERLQAADRIQEIFGEKFSQNPRLNLMLLGDGNVIRDDHGNKVLAKLSGADLGIRLVEVFEHFKGRVASWQSKGKESKLDYMFVSPNLLRHVRKWIVCGSFNPVASDHRPLMTVVELPETGHSKSRASSEETRTREAKPFRKRLQMRA